MRNFKRWNAMLLSGVFGLMAMVGFVNGMMDPYGIWNAPLIHGVNEHKSEKYTHQRLFRAVDLEQQKPQVLFLGSSRTFFGLDPKYYESLTGQPAYNLGLNATNTSEELAYLQHAIYNQPNLKEVVIGLDFYSFNAYNEGRPDFSAERLDKRHVTLNDAINTLFSWDAVKASEETLKYNREHPDTPLVEKDGLLTDAGIKRSHVMNLTVKETFDRELSTYLYSKQFFGSYQLTMDKYKELIRLCESKNIKVVAYISPSHATLWEAIKIAGLWPVFEQWKREISALTPVWDFSGYNSITTEPIRDTMQNYWDSSHYKKPVGNLVLDRLFNNHVQNVPGDFGFLMMPNNVEAHLSKIRMDQAAWEKKNQDVVNYVSRMKP